MAQVWVHSIFRKTDVHFLPIQKSYAVFWAILIRFRKQLVMNRVYVWVALFDLSSWLWRIWRPALVDCAKCDFMTFANQSTNRKLHCMWTLPMPVLAVAFFSTHRVQQRKRRLHLQRILNSVLPPFCAMRWKTTKRCWFMVLGIFVDTWGSSIRSLFLENVPPDDPDFFSDAMQVVIDARMYDGGGIGRPYRYDHKCLAKMNMSRIFQSWAKRN